MKFEKPIPVKDIASKIGATLIGEEQAFAYGINEIHNVKPGDITFVDFEKYYKYTLSSDASIIIIDKELEVPDGKTLLVTKHPFKAYNELAATLRPAEVQEESIHPSAEIAASARVSAGCVIGARVKIGADSFIGPNVTILDNCSIGKGVIIQANSVIGSDAFYYKRWDGGALIYEKMHSIGRVIIEDNVEIGAGCTIDRGVSADTIIGQGTKLDNHVHLGHEVVIGQNCLIAGQAGIAGNVVIGSNVKIWGQVGVSKNLYIADDAEVLAQSGVAGNIEKSGKYFGSPAAPARMKMKELKIMERLPLLWKSILKKAE